VFSVIEVLFRTDITEKGYIGFGGLEGE